MASGRSQEYEEGTRQANVGKIEGGGLKAVKECEGTTSKKKEPVRATGEGGRDEKRRGLARQAAAGSMLDSKHTVARHQLIANLPALDEV
ncbi:unnamed protein product [Fusarium graminearum]|uniref:Uncharacterized protein n=1 Tax=Gibberella zeae TaxID=5518 RepID=A0A4E9E907_GIBZA|nr:unnamed protein product [Fusarium graminearum]CAF3635318.1 unnamed protein product [Fusarium graminearum]CAG1973492.1 unnamed protein product [Fusarium graminearum]CAG1988926.1 unnamed protein product [Fusarium graminearum]